MTVLWAAVAVRVTFLGGRVKLRVTFLKVKNPLEPAWILDWEMLRRFKIERGVFFLRSASLPSKCSVIRQTSKEKKPLFNIIS
jgi:hypothetical protein